MKVKICGIKSLEAAKYAVEQGADAIGFVFAKSKRKITSMGAREIINELPAAVWKVGVFVNEDAETILQTAKTAGLTHIQLHGDEKMEPYKKIDIPIIRSVSVSSGEDLTRIKTLKTEFVLLDSPPEKFYGGNGMSFDWDLAEGIGASRQNVILAGGLNADNVQAAINKIQPFMVDVSSGVETDGQKDLLKIREFIYKAKRIEEE
ncbi:MAG: phosphoribosylanthranilate isomerase [Mesobacillus sp.]|uniref:phosphoribosylanthranilate isomerase n=1 Tax=Mesobacillus sp. TaxID=2675271 RepID=UPI003C66C95C